MDETREQQKIYSFMQTLVYFMLLLEVVVFCGLPDLGMFQTVLDRLKLLPIYDSIFYSKVAILFLQMLVKIGRASCRERV